MFRQIFAITATFLKQFCNTLRISVLQTIKLIYHYWNRLLQGCNKSETKRFIKFINKRLSIPYSKIAGKYNFVARRKTRKLCSPGFVDTLLLNSTSLQYHAEVAKEQRAAEMEKCIAYFYDYNRQFPQCLHKSPIIIVNFHKICLFLRL